MRVLVSLLLIVLLVDTRARAPKRKKSALLVGGERATNRSNKATPTKLFNKRERATNKLTNKRAKTSVCERAFRCSGLMDSTDPDVSVTPISYALSNHKHVHDKLARYGHFWSTIDIFFKCVVSRRLQQLRGAPKSMPSLPMQHVK